MSERKIARPRPSQKIAAFAAAGVFVSALMVAFLISRWFEQHLIATSRTSVAGNFQPYSQQMANTLNRLLGYVDTLHAFAQMEADVAEIDADFPAFAATLHLSLIHISEPTRPY
mgnify:CR=1 FL=1